MHQQLLCQASLTSLVCVPSRSFHPYANPEVLSLTVQDGSLAYMRWMDEAVPDD